MIGHLCWQTANNVLKTLMEPNLGKSLKQVMYVLSARAKFFYPQLYDRYADTKEPSVNVVILG